LDNIFLPFISGIGAGIFLGFGFGTVFFALIQNSINHGFRKGLDIALGVVLCDIFLTSIILFGSQYIDEIGEYKNIIKYSGGILLLGLGIYQFFPQHPIKNEFGELKRKGSLFFISKGFLLNFLNPINFLAWLGIQTYLKGANGYSTIQSVYFFVGAISTIFGIEVIISVLANYIGKRISDKVIRIINYTSGCIFVVLGILLFIKKI